MRKYVVSSTLTSPEWHNTCVIDSDPLAEIRRLKKQEGVDIVQYGFGRLSFVLLEAGLMTSSASGCTRSSSATGGPANLLYRDTKATMFELADVRLSRRVW